MQLSNGTIVAVCDGEKLNLFRNKGDEQSPDLVAMNVDEVDTDNKGSGGRHQSSAANPDRSQIEEDSFAAGAAEILNRLVLGGKVADLVIVAAPRTLGEMRKHYHAKLEQLLQLELAKDLTGHSTDDITKALANA